MRILYLSSVFPQVYEPTRGVFSQQLCRALSARHELRIIAPRPWVDEVRHPFRSQSTDQDDLSQRAGWQAYRPRYFYPPGMLRGMHAFCMWASIRRGVLRLLKEFMPDCVLSYWIYPDGAVAIRAAQSVGAPAVVMVGGSDVLVLPQQARWRRRTVKVLRAADAVVTVGDELKAETIKLGIAEDKVFVNPQGVDRRIFKRGDQKAARRRLMIPREGKMLLWVGRMVPVKGIDVLLKASSLLRDRGLGFRLYLVGDGPLRRPLESECRAQRLCEIVRFVGPVPHDELPNWYCAADVTVLPSRSEGVPNVLRESLACGTPFVASQVGGTAEIAQDPLNRLVPPGDHTALAEAIAQALAEGRRPHFRAESWTESADRLACILEGVITAERDSLLLQAHG
jgi:teichuronic acid biosynthesis glycosyltransferase TuaC